MAESKAKVEYHWGTGRRKTSVARVRVSTGTGKISINGREVDHYFTEEKDRNSVVGPLLLLDMRTRVDVFVNVQGGGFTGQGGAIRQGLARALKTMFGATIEAEAAAQAAPVPEGGTKPVDDGIAKRLRDSGFLTRDSRMKERKKYGRKGARKSFQFSKR